MSGAESPRPALEHEEHDVLARFSRPSPFSPESLDGLQDAPGVHVVWGGNGRLLYAGSSRTTRTRLRQHLTGDREGSVLHDKVGRLLDDRLGRPATRDDIRGELQSGWFAVAFAPEPDRLKAQVMDALRPPLNKIRPTESEPHKDVAAPLSRMLIDALDGIHKRHLGTGTIQSYKALIETALPAAIGSLLPPGFSCRGRTGVGDPADVPWVGIFPNDDTPAKRGVYVVLLFAADGSAAYLSLIQGTESVKGGSSVLTKRCLDIRDALPPQPDLEASIDLRSAVQRPKAYEAASAYARRYDAASVPSDNELRDDVLRFVALLTAVQDRLPEFPEKEPLHVLMKWSPELKAATLQEHKDVAAEKGAVWWGKIGKATTTPISEARLNAIKAQLDEGITTYCYLYRKGEVWATTLEKITTDASEIDLDRLPGYYSTDDCNLFALIHDFEQLPPDWPLKNLLLASNPAPEALPGALSNQTSPLLLFRRGRPSITVVDPPPEDPPTARDLAWLLRETLWPEADMRELVASLLTKGQVILAGPPGTGKTWVAERVAEYVTQGVAGAYRILQFHPSYGYEEFIEGLRPDAGAAGLTFSRVDGAVLRMSNEIDAASDQKHVLILDEMNRANLPRVFGELMYLLEYRERAIDLLYSTDYSLPDDLLFIGSMNTADRSIRSLDIALRRRFDVFECLPSADILSRYYTDPKNKNSVPGLIEGFVELNGRLEKLLDRHHTIGHSFFMRRQMTPDALRQTWRRQLGPLLEEYFFDQPDVAASLKFEDFWPGA